MTINDIYKNRRLYKYFCYFQKRFSIFTYFLVATIVGVSLCEPFVPNVTDIIMALFHSLDLLDQFKGGSALDPDFANLKYKQWLLNY